jgi:hypothetical protein
MDDEEKRKQQKKAETAATFATRLQNIYKNFCERHKIVLQLFPDAKTITEKITNGALDEAIPVKDQVTTKYFYIAKEIENILVVKHSGDIEQVKKNLKHHFDLLTSQLTNENYLPVANIHAAYENSDGTIYVVYDHYGISLWSLLKANEGQNQLKEYLKSDAFMFIALQVWLAFNAGFNTGDLSLRNIVVSAPNRPLILYSGDKIYYSGKTTPTPIFFIDIDDNGSQNFSNFVQLLNDFCEDKSLVCSEDEFILRFQSFTSTDVNLFKLARMTEKEPPYVLVVLGDRLDIDEENPIYVAKIFIPNPRDISDLKPKPITQQAAIPKQPVAVPLPSPAVPLPAVPLPAVQLPAVQLPAVQLPAVPLPAVPLPAVPLPAVPFPTDFMPYQAQGETIQYFPAYLQPFFAPKNQVDLYDYVLQNKLFGPYELENSNFARFISKAMEENSKLRSVFDLIVTFRPPLMPPQEVFSV